MLKRSSYWLALLVTVMGMSLPFDASARSAVCSKLERQLASAGTKVASGSEKYARAAREQLTQLKIARSQASNSGCRGSSILTASSSACSRIATTIRRMESNLAKLQSKAKGGTSRSDRSRILAALNANACDASANNEVVAKRKQPVAPKAKSDNFLTILFSGSKEPKQIAGSYEVASAEMPKKRKTVKVINGGAMSNAAYDIGSGTFRTICVRTCDGYYFPVSFSTTSSRFPTDEKACASMCPGAETKLYYHSVPDQEPEEMISLRKEPYAALPTAFQYRRDGVGKTAGCSCQAAVNEASNESEENADPILTKKKWIPFPAFKPSLIEDEESRINRLGGLNAESISELLAAKLGSKTLATQQSVRVVGPLFLPSQSTATSLPAQGHSNVQ